MTARTIVSSLWLIAGVFGISITLLFRVEPVSWAITIVLGILAMLVGIAMFRRADPRVSRWPTALGTAWVVCYAADTARQVGDPVALFTDATLALLGAATVLVSRRQATAGT